MRIGHRYDAHRPVPDRPLIIGGVRAPYERGLLDHSDADVLSHVVADSLLGATVLGDLGVRFPDTDPEWAGVGSLKLLHCVCELVGGKGYQIENIDVTVVTQAPKLRPYTVRTRECLASVRGIKIDAVSVKATTEGHPGFAGRGQRIVTHAVCLLKQKNKLPAHPFITHSVNKNREAMYVDKLTILLGSTIYAMKGRDTLFCYGIRLYVGRTPRTQDRLRYEYGTYVPDRTDQAEDILIHLGIRILRRSERTGAV